MKSTAELLDTLSSTREDVVISGVLEGLREQARAGDQVAQRALYSVTFQDFLAKSIVDTVKLMMQQGGVPPNAPVTIAAGLAGAIEEIGYRMPTLRTELNGILAELDGDATVCAKRVRMQAEFDARLDLANRLREQGMSTEYIKQKLRELNAAQLSDVMASQDRAEGVDLDA